MASNFSSDPWLTRRLVWGSADPINDADDIFPEIPKSGRFIPQPVDQKPPPGYFYHDTHGLVPISSLNSTDALDEPQKYYRWHSSSHLEPPIPLPQKLTQIAEKKTSGDEPFPDATDYKSPPGSGYLFSHPVLKGAWGGPFSEMRALSKEGAPASSYFGPAMMVAGSSLIPGAGLLGLLGGIFNKLGAYHQFTPAMDSNLFVNPDTGSATWRSLSPGGSGSQRGTLNLYNMLQDYGGSYPTRQVQTPRGYANARDLAYIMAQGERAPEGLYTQQTPYGYQDFGEGHNVTNQEALNTYNLTGAGPILNEAAAVLGPDAGYNETIDMAEALAEAVEHDMSNQSEDYWGGW